LNPATDEIVCAVTKQGDDVLHWAEPDRPGKTFTPELTHKLANYLADDGHVIVSFNGLGFDLRFLCEKLANAKLKRKVATAALYRHADIFYCFLTSQGFNTSLSSLLSEADFAKPMTGKDAAERVSVKQKYLAFFKFFFYGIC